jgi:tubulin--tyrosine ligase
MVFLNMSVQPLPNAFELYGVDFMIQHNTRASGRPRFQALLLEINAEPAIEMTGPRLTWILEDLFVSMAKICVQPFINRHYGPQEQSILDEGSMDGIMSTTVDNLAVQKVLDIKVRGVGGW